MYAVVTYHTHFHPHKWDLSAHTREQNERKFRTLASTLPTLKAESDNFLSRCVNPDMNHWTAYDELLRDLHQFIYAMEDLYGEDNVPTELSCLVFN